MTDLEFSRDYDREQNVTGPNATLGVSVAALALALLLGLSAADLHRHKSAAMEQAFPTPPAIEALDGRGKWSGIH